MKTKLKLITFFFVLITATSAHSQEDAISTDELSSEGLTNTSQSSDIEELTPLELRSFEHSDCGVLRYKQIEHPSCGDVYHSKRTKSCGVELYKDAPHPNCPGSTKYEEYEIKWKQKCKTGFVKKEIKGKPGITVGREHEHTIGGTPDKYFCIKTAVNKKCRLKANGIESYKLCEHKDHGLKGYKTCDSTEPESFKTCEMYIPSDEIPFFVTQKKSTLPLMIKTYFTLKSNYFIIKESKQQMACTIAKAVESGLTPRALVEMKATYQAIFSETLDLQKIDCSQTDLTLEQNPLCTENPDLPECDTLTSYNGVAHWLDVLQTDLVNIQSQTNIQDAKIKDSILGLSERIMKL